MHKLIITAIAAAALAGCCVSPCAGAGSAAMAGNVLASGAMLDLVPSPVVVTLAAE